MAVGLEGHVRSGGLGAAGGLSILAPGHEPGGTVRGGIRGSRDLGQAGRGGREETFCGSFREMSVSWKSLLSPVGLSFSDDGSLRPGALKDSYHMGADLYQ